jgi:formyl-CoA transferase
LRPILADRLKTRSRAAWIEALTAAGVPCGSVRDLGELFSDPQIAARHMIEAVPHADIGPLRVLGTPLKLSDTPAAIRTAPPTLGQHTATILSEDLQFTPDDVAALRAKGII